MGKGKSIFGEWEGKKAHCNEILIPSVDQKMARKNLKGFRGDEGEPLHEGKEGAAEGRLSPQGAGPALQGPVSSVHLSSNIDWFLDSVPPPTFLVMRTQVSCRK